MWIDGWIEGHTGPVWTVLVVSSALVERVRPPPVVVVVVVVATAVVVPSAIPLGVAATTPSIVQSMYEIFFASPATVWHFRRKGGGGQNARPFDLRIVCVAYESSSLRRRSSSPPPPQPLVGGLSLLPYEPPRESSSRLSRLRLRLRLRLRRRLPRCV